MNIRTSIIGALALAATLSSGLAQARGGNDVQWSVTIGAPIGVPVYSQPYPVYSYPAPVVVHRPYSRGYYQQPTRWDRDGDGVPNRYDRVYNPRWDRDGDGIPNRYDRRDRYDRYDRYGGHHRDRDHDGIPNWRDRNDGGH